MGGGGPIGHGVAAPDGIRLVSPNRRPGRGASAGVGLERIFGGPSGGFRMFGGGGGSAVGIANMLFGDVGPIGGGRGGPLADGGMNRLTMRFGMPMGDEEGGGPAQRFVQMRGVDPSGQERPLAASLLSRMMGMHALQGVNDTQNELLEVSLVMITSSTLA